MKNNFIITVGLLLDITFIIIALQIDYSVIDWLSGVGTAMLVIFSLDLMIGIRMGYKNFVNWIMP